MRSKLPWWQRIIIAIVGAFISGVLIIAFAKVWIDADHQRKLRLIEDQKRIHNELLQQMKVLEPIRLPLNGEYKNGG